VRNRDKRERDEKEMKRAREREIRNEGIYRMCQVEMARKISLGSFAYHTKK